MTRTALLLLAFVLAWRPAAAQPSDDERAVSAVLDALHDAASKAAFERYFGLFAEDAVFLGTDATERWSVAAFKAYAKPIFDQGRGWTYTPTERHVYIARDGQTAWFDERLENANLGETRGTGVLVREGGTWKIAQYNLTIPIPNALAREVVRMIRAAKQ
ncbi:nuclear transport factor 2 family protein [Rhodocaloribacter sp.]